MRPWTCKTLLNSAVGVSTTAAADDDNAVSAVADEVVDNFGEIEDGAAMAGIAAAAAAANEASSGGKVK